MKKFNCWEFKGCEREDINTCLASTEICTNGVNDGKNGGRACWAVVGTHCGGKVQGSFAGKHFDCMGCDFYNHVKKEEGSEFITGSELVIQLLHKDQFA